MKIGIDFHLAEREGTGNCTYMRNLVESLLALDSRNEYILYITRENYPYHERFRAHKNASLSYIGSGSPLERMFRLGRQTFRDDIDILHVNYYGPPFYHGKLIMTVHDLSFEHLPDCFTTFERVKDRILIPFYIRRADRILTVSEFSRQDMVALYGANPDKIVVGYNGVNPAFKPLTDGKVVVHDKDLLGQVALFGHDHRQAEEENSQQKPTHRHKVPITIVYHSQRQRRPVFPRGSP